MSRNVPLRHAERGATTIEHTLALPLFCLLVFTILDLCGACYNQLSLQFSVTRIMRQASVTPSMTPTQVRTEMTDALGRLGVRLAATDHVTLCPARIYRTAACPENTVISGLPTELMVLHIRKSYGTIVNNFLPRFLSLEAQVLGRNEPL